MWPQVTLHGRHLIIRCPGNLIRATKAEFNSSDNFANFVPRYRNDVFNYFYAIEGNDSLKAIQDLSVYVQKIDGYLATLSKQQALDYAAAFTHIHSALINQVEADLAKSSTLTASKDATQLYYYNSLKGVNASVDSFIRTAYKNRGYDEAFFTNFVTDYTTFNNLLQVLMLKETSVKLVNVIPTTWRQLVR